MGDDLSDGTSNLPALPDDPGQFILYQTEDGLTRVEVRVFRETVWLSLSQMAELFQRDKSVISRHIANVFQEGELGRKGTVAEFATVQTEGPRRVERRIEHYNLDVIISVGYRVKSHRGTQFRIWATQRLREYLIKGFSLDDQRLKQAGSGNYFDELLARIRDIRSSEKVFWRKILAIYATSIDYDPNMDISRQFFATVQNKMHWAAHGHTAAEIIVGRADAGKPHMGLTAWTGDKLRKSDIAVAKDYLNKEELEALNLIVSFYLTLVSYKPAVESPCTCATGLPSWMTSFVCPNATFSPMLERSRTMMPWPRPSLNMRSGALSRPHCSARWRRTSTRRSRR
ncbi:MAG: virulence RhuM family protein [Sedimentisphaerales bacterium]|nr:virulence RhuM family protein [Sedimentisphaerales bacterium]